MAIEKEQCILDSDSGLRNPHSLDLLMLIRAGLKGFRTVQMPRIPRGWRWFFLMKALHWAAGTGQGQATAHAELSRLDEEQGLV